MREKDDLVSISIPFYNSEDFLSEAIDSVLAQTYSHWELFLVDDGSTDRSTEIAQKYAARFPKQITYLEHPGHRNRGQTCSRNLAVRNARGEYLAFLDSDDVWLPHKLHDQMSLMSAHPDAGMIYGLSEYWYDWDRTKPAPRKNHIPSLAPAGRLYLPTTLLTDTHPLGPFGAPCPSSFLLRRTAFDRVGGFEECFNPETYQVVEDTAFLTKIYCTTPVFVAGICWDRYRRHDRSVWQVNLTENKEEAALRFFFRWLRQYLRRQHISDPQLLRAVRKKAWQYWLPLPAPATRFIRRVENRLSRQDRP